jgi:hypothetical protein
MSLREKLVAEIDEAIWALLEVHHKREAVFYLKAGNDLAQVAAMVAEDKAHLIKGLMDAGELAKVSEEQVKIWETRPEYKFKFIIISPYVFIQD